jgi:hypothetical protein
MLCGKIENIPIKTIYHTDNDGFWPVDNEYP